MPDNLIKWKGAANGKGGPVRWQRNTGAAPNRNLTARLHRVAVGMGCPTVLPRYPCLTRQDQHYKTGLPGGGNRAEFGADRGDADPAGEKRGRINRPQGHAFARGKRMGSECADAVPGGAEVLNSCLEPDS